MSPANFAWTLLAGCPKLEPISLDADAPPELGYALARWGNDYLEGPSFGGPKNVDVSTPAKKKEYLAESGMAIFSMQHVVIPKLK